MKPRRAIFLDRDGVINVNRPDHVKSWDEFVFLPRVLEALRYLAASEFVVVVITNQSTIGRGSSTTAAIEHIHAQMLAAIKNAGGRIDAVYYCPHKPDDGCDCRKPQTGMYRQAARELNLDLTQSIVVGDALTDITAAQAIGARAILVLTGRGQEHHAELQQQNHLSFDVATDLMGAVDLILREPDK